MKFLCENVLHLGHKYLQATPRLVPRKASIQKTVRIWLNMCSSKNAMSIEKKWVTSKK